MKIVLSALLVWALVPAILAEDEKLWILIGEKLDPSPHIIGGDEAKPGAFPHQVYLDISFSPKQRTFCGGSLIHPQWVLTVAHCVKIKTTRLVAVLGLHDRNNLSAPNTQAIKVDKIFIEEEYKKKNTDIALLKLEKPANMTEFVQTIRIPAKSLKGTDLAGTPAEVIGWGKFKLPINTNGVSQVLLHARNKVISNQECKRKAARRITEWHICTERTDDKGPCKGDSGGPVFMTEKDGKRTLIGIISFGSPICKPGTPAVYTRVDYWLDWINKLTGIPLRD